MHRIFRDNRLFFCCFFLFLILASVLLIANDKGDAIFFFSQNRSELGDLFFKYFTHMGEALAYISIAVICLFIRFRYSLLIGLTGGGVSLVSYFLKAYFAHDRPSLFFRKLNMLDQVNLVQGVDLNTAATSFPSGHTMAAFALYSLLILLLPKRKRYALPLFFIALLVAVSRIYLVQHFLEDVFLGAILGLLIAVLVYWVNSRFDYNPRIWVDRSFLLLKREADKLG